MAELSISSVSPHPIREFMPACREIINICCLVWLFFSFVHYSLILWVK
jgi:hypothetical protein